MASANVELVRSIYAANERGDFSSADWAHPEIEFVFADGPAPGSWKGLEGIQQAWREFLSTWEGYHVKVDEYRTWTKTEFSSWRTGAAAARRAAWISGRCPPREQSFGISATAR